MISRRLEDVRGVTYRRVVVTGATTTAFFAFHSPAAGFGTCA